MKVAYVFSTSGHTASYKLGKMILPQLEAGNHGAKSSACSSSTTTPSCCAPAIPWVSGWPRSPREKGMLLMLCDQCAAERNLAEPKPGGGYLPKDVCEGVQVGCFPDLYAALAGSPPDQVITI